MPISGSSMILAGIAVIFFIMAGIYFQSLIPKTVTYHYLINGEPVTKTVTFDPYWPLLPLGIMFTAFGCFVIWLLISIESDSRKIRERT